MVDIKFYGKTDYQLSLELQQAQVERALIHPSQVAIQGFEFDPIITLGRRAQASQEVLWPLSKSPPVVTVQRGGKATLHSPGQLVIYPICNIKFHCKEVKPWVQFLLQMTVETLKSTFPKESFSTNMERTGIYTPSGKVASIGLRIDRGVSYFGLAINLKNDPELFKSIRPCGVDGQRIHSLKDPKPLEDFFKAWSHRFLKEFDFGRA